jgi:hypothetical protein
LQSALCGEHFYDFDRFPIAAGAHLHFRKRRYVADAGLPIFLYLSWIAADGEVIYSDYTRVRILSCLKENKELKEEERRGTHTSELVIEVRWRKIAIYTNDQRRAGENLYELLKARSAELGRLIQMSGALAANWSGQEETVEAKCLAHARESSSLCPGSSWKLPPRAHIPIKAMEMNIAVNVFRIAQSRPSAKIGKVRIELASLLSRRATEGIQKFSRPSPRF